MANKLKGEVEISIGEGDERKTLVFRLGMNELISLQDALGYTDDKEEKFLADVDSGRAFNGLKKTRKAVRFALLSRQPETTEEEAGEVVTELGPQRIGEIIREAFKWSMPEKESGTSKGKDPSPSAGKPS